MKIFRLLLSIVAISLLFSACETDFDTVAPYEDITVVYGLLDQKTENQYIKINKAFLGEGNALVYAKEADSSNYGYPLEVVLEEFDENGQMVNSIVFDTTTVYNKEPGVFYAPEQVVYKGKPDQAFEIKPIIVYPHDTIGYDTYWLNDESTYKLKIKNPVSGKEISSETKLVHDFEIKKPGFAQFIKFVNNPESQTKFEWGTAENGGLYELKIIFHYREAYLNSSDTLDKSIELVTLIETPSTLDVMTYFYSDANFFISCLRDIPYPDQADEQNVVYRFSGPVETIVSVAETEFSLYMAVYEPSTSIVQEKPEYTNIENGIGVFSARYRKSKIKKIHSETISDLKDINDNVLKFEY